MVELCGVGILSICHLVSFHLELVELDSGYAYRAVACRRDWSSNIFAPAGVWWAVNCARTRTVSLAKTNEKELA